MSNERKPDGWWYNDPLPPIPVYECCYKCGAMGRDNHEPGCTNVPKPAPTGDLAAKS